ncbi:hypothetical protein Misp01_80930 [Microtetraspora sp. NBRC 13810]|uniref:FUSC family protein n=1 Tax=Microtetraspora sp. NBRC 13810 TaxID=3030990 RepID=UPI0024A182A6|nr:FUSC family protein [Microtetraspora sp. NBRC 13810]GLW12965.1 hypothetical protein Misp01_80930 [Microtetraspora sp. NBRC 13810]
MKEALRKRRRRLTLMAPTIIQCAVAAGLAWIVARDVLGHPRPFFAPIAVVVCIGVALGRRLRRLVELVVGVSLGVGVGDLLISQIGGGAWQITLVVALAMGVAVFLDSGSVMTLQAGSSAVLVATLLPPGGTGGVDRMVDTLVGGCLGIAAVALLPVSPAAIAHRYASAVFEALATALEDTAEAIERSDVALASAALREVRGTQPVVDELLQALKAGREIATISPLQWRRRRGLVRYETAGTRLDLALRNTRVLARRTIVALDAGAPMPPGLPGVLRELAGATRLLDEELSGGREPKAARARVLGAVPELGDDPGEPGGFSADVMTAQVRSIAVDLLQATGMDRDASRAALPPRV